MHRFTILTADQVSSMDTSFLNPVLRTVEISVWGPVIDNLCDLIYDGVWDQVGDPVETHIKDELR